MKIVDEPHGQNVLDEHKGLHLHLLCFLPKYTFAYSNASCKKNLPKFKQTLDNPTQKIRTIS